MKEFAPDYVVHIVRLLVDMARDTSEGDQQLISPGSEFDTSLVAMISEFERRGLISAFDLLKRIKVTLDQKQLRAGAVVSLTNDLVTRIQDDMGRTIYFRLEGDEPDYYSGRKPDWGNATTVFPIREEVSEGSKCFALGRDQAAVFHMMRVLDVGLHALADELQVPFSQHINANWENIINDVEKKIRDIPSSDSHRKIKQHFYGAAASHFFYVKEAWRNYVMHVKQSHNHGTALGVMIAVSEFMKQLAAKRPWT